MSNVLYSLKSKGIRLISSEQSKVGVKKIAENKITACKHKRLSWRAYLSAIGSSRSLRAFAVALPLPFGWLPRWSFGRRLMAPFGKYYYSEVRIKCQQ